MGKPTGFMEYERKTSLSEEPKERVRHFNEFHEHLPPEQQQLLARYVGWGGLADAFDARKGNWHKEYQELKEKRKW